MADIINMGGFMKKLYFISLLFFSTVLSANASTVIGTVNGTPITDTDITARVALMNKQGNVSTNNRRQAFQNIIDDYIKLNYATNYNVKITDDDADKELKKMNLGDLDSTMKSMARLAMKSDISWQVIIARTIVPSIDVSESDIKAERSDLIRERGLPLEITLVRLIDIPEEIAKKLTKPHDCKDAVSIAERLGGTPQTITALQYELSPDIRERIADLPLLNWSKIEDDSVLLVCKETKTKEYKGLDEIIKQNAIYKKASFNADQQLKQLRRKAMIIINDDRYKL